MHQPPPEHNTPTAPSEDKPRPLSEHDPTDATRNRPPVLLIVIVVLVVTGFVVLHLTGVLGPGSH